jgi:hypothetical protein
MAFHISMLYLIGASLWVAAILQARIDRGGW